MNWTAPLVRDWIQLTFDVSFSERGTHDLLYPLGLSYTKPTYTLKKADTTKQATSLKDLNTLKN